MLKRMLKKTRLLGILKGLVINLLKDLLGNVKRMNLERIFKLNANNVKYLIEKKYVQGRRNGFFLGEAQKNFPFFLPKSLKFPSCKSLKFGEAAASPVPVLKKNKNFSKNERSTAGLNVDLGSRIELGELMLNP